MAQSHDTSRKIDRICRGLARYYKTKNKPYNKLFSTFCVDSELDDDAIQADLEEGVENSVIVDFDPNFPYDGPSQDKNEFIYNKIKQCAQDSNITFVVDPPKFDQQFFEITQQFYDETKGIYQTQCTKIYNCGMEKDEAFLTLLAVSRKNNFDYLQHLVDDYFRSKVQNANNGSWNVMKWIKNHKHFEKLQQIKHKVLGKSTPYELATNAVYSFGKRCCPQLLLKPLKVINDSIETIIRYIESVAVAIANNLNQAGPLKTKRAICPFQIDLCIASQPPERLQKQINVDENDHEQDSKKDDEDWVNCVGDIRTKLEKNNLKYVFAKIKAGRPHFKAFTTAFNDLELKEKNNEHKSDGTFCYLHKKRLVALVDRREIMTEHKTNDDEKDPVYVFPPPINCSKIPSDVCGLWYISASRTCLLPDLNFGNGKTAEQQEEGNKSNETADGLKKANITSGFHCQGGLLTISFHVKSKNEVKMYLYFNGQIIRFMPEDIQTTLPLLFNMKWNNGENKTFIENKEEVEPIINSIKKTVKDAYFDAFQRSFG